MKPVDVKPKIYTDFGIKNNDKYPKFEVGNHVRISKYKNILAKGYVPNQFEEAIKNLKKYFSTEICNRIYKTA